MSGLRIAIAIGCLAAGLLLSLYGAFACGMWLPGGSPLMGGVIYLVVPAFIGFVVCVNLLIPDDPPPDRTRPKDPDDED